MGELSRIGSLVIYLRFFDTKQHHKPHVHVKYNEDEAVVALDGEMLSGCLPVKQRRILDGWLCTKKKHTRHGILQFREKRLRKSLQECNSKKEGHYGCT